MFTEQRTHEIKVRVSRFLPCVFGLYIINTNDILQDIDKNTGIGEGPDSYGNVVCLTHRITLICGQGLILFS